MPDAPSGVAAVAGNGSASVSWTGPTNGGNPITSYTITPYIGSIAQPSTPITGTPRATQATINGLTNGTTYTFTVTATNGLGSGPASAPSNAVTPAPRTAPVFVQSKSANSLNVTSLTVTPASPIVAENRLLVETGAWNSTGSTVSSVTDSAGNNYVELGHWKASEKTEMTIWSAPVTAGGGTQPTITVTPAAKADVGAAVLEYSGVSSVAGATLVDQIARHRYDQKRRLGLIRRHSRHHRGQRGRARVLRRLRFRRHTDTGIRLDLADQRLQHTRSRAASRG